MVGGEREGGGEKNTKQNNKTATLVILLYFLTNRNYLFFACFLYYPLYSLKSQAI